MQQTLLLGRVLQMNDTTTATPAVNLAAIANDGLLAGRELESDAELVALGWAKPERVSLADLRAAVALVSADDDADLLAEIHRAIEDNDFGLAGYSDAFRKVVITGRTPGKPEGTPTVSRIRLLSSTDSIRETVATPSVAPVRSHYPAMDCKAFGSKFRQSRASDGRLVIQYLDCDDCLGCLLWRQFLSVRRFQHVATGTATVIDCPGHRTVDAARETATRLARFGAGSRATTIQRGADYLWTVFAVWPMPVEHGPFADAMERSEIVGTIVDRAVSASEFASRCPLAPTEPSTTETRPDGTPKRRRLVLFHKWADYADSECNYRLDDGKVEETPVADIGKESTPLTPEEMHRSSLPMPHQQYLYSREWLPEGSKLNRGMWDALVDAWDTNDLAAARAQLADLTGQNLTYSGPTRLLRDVAGWLIRGALPGEWSEGYRPVFDALGMNGLPTPTCCQCRNEVPAQSPDGVCVRCKLGGAL